MTISVYFSLVRQILTKHLLCDRHWGFMDNEQNNEVLPYMRLKLALWFGKDTLECKH